MKIQLLRHLKLIDGLEPVVKLREPGLTIATQNVLRVLGLNGTVGEETHEEWIKIDCHTKPLTVDDVWHGSCDNNNTPHGHPAHSL